MKNNLNEYNSIDMQTKYIDDNKENKLDLNKNSNNPSLIIKADNNCKSINYLNKNTLNYNQKDKTNKTNNTYKNVIKKKTSNINIKLNNYNSSPIKNDKKLSNDNVLLNKSSSPKKILKKNSANKINNNKFKNVDSAILENFTKLNVPENIKAKICYRDKIKLLETLFDIRMLDYTSKEELFDILNAMLMRCYKKCRNLFYYNPCNSNIKMINSNKCHIKFIEENSNKFDHFIHCGPILITINPGANLATSSVINHKGDYYTHKEIVNTEDENNTFMNLNNWLANNCAKKRNKNPHIYSYINNIYKMLLKEKTNQAITIQGQIGSGKTYTLVHLLEALCYISNRYNIENSNNINNSTSYVNKANQNFDVIHRAFQIIHILSSVFRNENMEATCGGILIKMGFDNITGKQLSIDIESDLLDISLPYSENGRSYSILHALVTSASDSLKKSLNLPKNCNKLNFFSKFNNYFSDDVKEKFKLNDYEVFTRFNSLLNFFKFSKVEISSLYKILSFVLLCNDFDIGKKEILDFDNNKYTNKKNSIKSKIDNVYESLNKKHKTNINSNISYNPVRNNKDGNINRNKNIKNYEYTLIKCKALKQACLCLDMYEIDFINEFGTFNSIEELKTNLICLIKYSYTIIFEFVLVKVKEYLKIYSYCLQKDDFKNINLSRFYYKDDKEKEAYLKNNDNNLNTSKYKKNNYFKSIDNSVNENVINKNILRDNSLLKENISVDLTIKNESCIYFLDNPGELYNQTLGGLFCNLFNECVSTYTSEEYHSVIERLNEQNIFIDKIKVLKSVNIVQSCLDTNYGLLNFISIKNIGKILSSNNNSNNNNNVSKHKNESIEKNINYVNSNLHKINSFNYYEDNICLNNQEYSNIINRNINNNKEIYDIICSKYIKNLKEIKDEDNTYNYYKLNDIIKFSNYNVSYPYNFNINFSYNSVSYDFKNLCLESETIIAKINIINLLNKSLNPILLYAFGKNNNNKALNINFTFINNFVDNIVYFEKQSIYNLFLRKMDKLFSPIKDIKNYIIYTLHSNNSVQSYFDNQYTSHNSTIVRNSSIINKKNSLKSNNSNILNKIESIENLHNLNSYNNVRDSTIKINNIDNLNYSYKFNYYNLPYKLTKLVLKNSLLYSILNWKWFGFTEWFEINEFLKIYYNDFELAKQKLLSNSKKNDSIKNVDISEFTQIEKVNFMLSIFLPQNYYIIGKQFILFKKDSLKLIDKNLKSLVRASYIGRKFSSSQINEKKYNSSNNYLSNIRYNARGKSLIYSGNSQKLHDNIYNNNDYILNQNNKNVTFSNSINIINKKYNKKNTFNYLLEESNRYQCEINLYINNISDNNSYNLKEYYKSFLCTSNYSIFNIIFLSQKNSITNNFSKEYISTEAIDLNLDNFDKCLNLSYLQLVNIKAKNNLEVNYLKNKKTLINNKLNELSKISKIEYPRKNSSKLNKKLSINSINNSSMNSIHDNYNSELVINNNIKKSDLLNELKHVNELLIPLSKPLIKYNVVEPSFENMHVIKSLFDYLKLNKFNIYDYNDHLDSIILIQSQIRKFISIKRYKSFKYAEYSVILIQKHFISYLTRKKFAKFVDIYKSIIFIQKFYKKRIKVKLNSIIKIQTMFRCFKARQKLIQKNNKRKMKIMIYLEETGQIKDVNNLDDWENIKNFDQYSYPSDLDLDNSTESEINKKLDNELESISMKVNSTIKVKNNSLKESISNIRKSNSVTSIIENNNSNLLLINQLKNADKKTIINVMMNDIKESIKEQHQHGPIKAKLNKENFRKYYHKQNINPDEYIDNNFFKNYDYYDMKGLGINKKRSTSQKEKVFNIYNLIYYIM